MQIMCSNSVHSKLHQWIKVLICLAWIAIKNLPNCMYLNKHLFFFSFFVMHTCAHLHTNLCRNTHTHTHTHMTLKASICCILFLSFFGGGGVGSWRGMDFVLWNGYYDYTGNFNCVFICMYSYCGDTFHDIDVTQVIIFPLWWYFVPPIISIVIFIYLI